jgi:[NiFe] hydrogenase diaphorase moiety small subunit
MNQTVTFTLDGREIEGRAGQTIMEAADEAGVYIPRLCALKGLLPHGSCRVCVVMVNGRPQTACTQPVTPGAIVDNKSEKLQDMRKAMIEMLFVEGNHYCMYCEKSGNCELQALAYRFGITAPRFPYMFPERDLDATHPGVFIDRNRCVLCARCVRASETLDEKHVFDFVGRGPKKMIAVDAEHGLGATDLKATDRAIDACPVGAIVRKRTAYRTPVGQRKYDHQPIGSEIESGAKEA